MIHYIVNFVLCSGLLLLVYRVFLGSENLYRFNRFYLLFSLVFSLTVPLVTVHIPYPQIPGFQQQVAEQLVSTRIANTFQVHAISTTVSSSALQQVSQTPKHNYLPDVLLLLYGITTLVMLVRFARNSYHISRIVTRNTIINYSDTKLVLVDEDVTPHSFLKYIFINKDKYHSNSIEPEIICHEQTHVKQLHSLDIILVELLQVVCWFNPFIFLYRRAMQLNHEFLADAAVIENYRDTIGYQYLLLDKASENKSLYLTSQFNYSVTKNRLIMMSKTTSAATAWLIRLAIVPVITIAFLLFSNKTMAALSVKSTKKTSLTAPAAQDTKIDEFVKLPADYKPAKTYINAKGYKIEEGGYSANGKTYYVAIISNRSGKKISDADDKAGRVVIYKGAGNASGEDMIYRRFGYKFPDVKVSELKLKPGPPPPMPMPIMIHDDGFNALRSFSNRVEYPQQALDHEIQGSVVAKFNVDKDHKITDVKLVSGLGYGCDEQVINMLKTFPGKVNGKYNNYVVGVSFTLFGRTKKYPKVRLDQKVLDAPNRALAIELIGYGK